MEEVYFSAIVSRKQKQKKILLSRCLRATISIGSHKQQGVGQRSALESARLYISVGKLS